MCSFLLKKPFLFRFWCQHPSQQCFSHGTEPPLPGYQPVQVEVLVSCKGTQPSLGAPVAKRLRALFLNHSLISPLCLVRVRAPLWPHVRQAKFRLRVCQVFLARLHEVHRAIAVTSVVHVPVPVPVPVRVRVRVTLALKFSRSPYLDNHSSESIHTWTIDTL